MANGPNKDPNQPIVGQPEDVIISFDGKTLRAEPDTVRLGWETGPDSVGWRVESNVPNVSIAIMFNEETCFNACGVTTDGRILGTNNTRVKGHFKYTVVAYDSSGRVVGVLDPKVVNDPGGGG